MRNALHDTGDVVAGIALGIAAMAVVDNATTSASLQRLVGAVLVIAALAGWGICAAVRKVRGTNQSTDSQVHNLSSWGLGKGLTRRFRRG